MPQGLPKPGHAAVTLASRPGNKTGKSLQGPQHPIPSMGPVMGCGMRASSG